MKRSSYPLRGVCLVLLMLPALAGAQGIIIWPPHPRPPDPPERPAPPVFELKELRIAAQIRDQIAEVRLNQTFHNPGDRPLQAEYLFPLPEDSAVQDFVLMMDGKELPGRILDRDEARKLYEEIVRKQLDPALLEYVGRGLFRASIFPIPGGADREITLRYSQVLTRDHDAVNLTIPLADAQSSSRPIQRFELEVVLESNEAIKSIYCPTHDVTIDRTGDRTARARVSRNNFSAGRDFRLLYTLEPGTVGATLLSHWPAGQDEGYFMLLASPQFKSEQSEPMPKAVVFVLDRSGSMNGRKIEQAREALRFVLNNLNAGDTFNIVLYDDRVEAFKTELVGFDETTRAEAVGFIDNIRPGGSTNIDAALTESLRMLPAENKSRPAYVLFLTDGLPTAGEKNEMKIAERCRESNRSDARVFAFGVGEDVNARLLDRVSGGNGGASVYVRPGEDIEASVSDFYTKITSPVLADLEFALTGRPTNRVYPRDLPDLFLGGQLIAVGRYRESGDSKIELKGHVAGKEQTFEFPATLAAAASAGRYEFIERLWATRRIGFLIDQIDLHGKSDELIDELVELSKRYGIMTPYTSFLAEEEVRLSEASIIRGEAVTRLGALDQVSGAGAQAQRDFKGGMMSSSAPARPQAAPTDERYFLPGIDRARAYAEAEAVNTNIRAVGRKTFYHKAGGWIDSEAETVSDGNSIIEIDRFSNEYFGLIDSLPAGLLQYLTFDEPVTVELEGKVYRID